jgi:hypothetical protein
MLSNYDAGKKRSLLIKRQYKAFMCRKWGKLRGTPLRRGSEVTKIRIQNLQNTIQVWSQLSHDAMCVCCGISEHLSCVRTYKTRHNISSVIYWVSLVFCIKMVKYIMFRKVTQVLNYHGDVRIMSHSVQRLVKVLLRILVNRGKFMR